MRPAPSRAAFLALGASALLATAVARAQSDADPATSANAPALRVLLGQGMVQGGAPGNGGFSFDGRPYRGTYSELPDGRIVNTVDVERYLYSVVPREMPPAWPAAALQAQALCARTYVLQRSNPARGYDLVPSEADQVYAGISSESAAGSAAVDATAGQVLRFGSGYASIAYSSCCGGHTEASADAWGSTFVPYLGGVACPYCTDSPNYRWSVQLGLDAVAARFTDRTESVGNLTSIRISSVDASGRARTFDLIGDRGTATVKGSAFRLAVGPRVLRSLLIVSLAPSGDGSSDAPPQARSTVFIEGGGLGHGVGMCQWGARGMALAGHTARDVVSFYFPGTEIGND